MLISILPTVTIAAESTQDPQLKDLIVHYNLGEEEKQQSILNGSPEISFSAGSELIFEVKFLNPQRVGRVYVTSTVDDETQYLTAEYNADTQTFLTSGYFGDDKNYIPGIIKVEYTKNTADVGVTEDIDWALLPPVLSTDNITLESSTEKSVQATVDLSSLFEAEGKVLVDMGIDIFDASTDSNLNEWLGDYKDLDKLASYIIPGKDDKQYILYLDYSDPATYAMIVKDVSGNKYTKMLLEVGAGSSKTLAQIVDNLSTINTVSKLVYDYYSIEKESDNLREQVEQNTHMTLEQKKEANEKIDALDKDKKAFSVITILLPIAVGAGVTMGGPAIIFSALLGSIVASADYFWDWRVGMIVEETAVKEQSWGVSGISDNGTDYSRWTLNREGVLTISGNGRAVMPTNLYDYKSAIKRVVVKSGITSIGDLYECTNLIKVSLPEGLTEIRNDAFTDCTKLTDFTIPRSVKYINAISFYNTAYFNNPDNWINGLLYYNDWLISAVEYGAVNNNNSYEAYHGNYYIKDGTKYIADGALPDTKAVYIPSSVTDINGVYYSTVKDVLNVYFGGSQNEWNNINVYGYSEYHQNDFKYCYANANIHYNCGDVNIISGKCGDNVTWTIDTNIDWKKNAIKISGNGEMYDYTDYKVPWLEYYQLFTTVEIGNGITHIGDKSFAYSFSDMITYYSIYIDKIICSYTVKTIGNEAFFDLQTLKYVDLANVEKIDSSAFQRCNNLSTISLSNVKEIEMSAFSGCESLEDINLSNVNYIGSNAFDGCKSIKSVIINPLSYMDTYVFKGCTSLTNIHFLPKLPSEFDENYYNLGFSTFESCSNLQKIVLPDGFSDIPIAVFADCINLQSITIPASMDIIQRSAFYNCNNLKDVYYKGSKEDWERMLSDELRFDKRGNEALLNATIHYNSTGEEDKPQPNVPVTSVKLDNSKVNMIAGSKFIQLSADVSTDATNKKLVWSSSNENVATVDNTGKVTAKSAGTTTITAEAADGSGQKASCIITVDSLPAGLNAYDVYNIKFDTDGGIMVDNLPNLVQVAKGHAYKMPVATKNGYTLKYWQDKADSNKTYAANNAYTFAADTDLLAIWDKNQTSGGSGSSHRPNNNGGTTNTTKPNKPEDNNKTETSISNNITKANINSIFADVQNNAWYSDAIAYVYNKGIMNGTEKGFEPNATTTRAMLVTMLHRLENEPAVVFDKFTDVASGQWFSNAIAWAAANNIVNGYSDTQFAPNMEITREQLAAILYRFAQFKGYDVSIKGELNSFGDGAQVSDWAKEAMLWAVGVGIINGDNGNLKPQGNATRAEVAIMLMRFIENYK